MQLITGTHCTERNWRWIARGVDSEYSDSAVLLFQLLARYRIASDDARSVRDEERKGGRGVCLTKYFVTIE